MTNTIQKNILVVDDEDDLRSLLKLDFELEGYKVFTAENGAIALEVLAVQKIDLIISDVRMPKLDGVDMLKKIRKVNPTLPMVILVSGFTDYTEKDAVELGALKLFAKPIDMDRLIEFVGKSLQ